jgi:hypothetical protein
LISQLKNQNKSENKKFIIIELIDENFVEFSWKILDKIFIESVQKFCILIFLTIFILCIILYSFVSFEINFFICLIAIYFAFVTILSTTEESRKLKKKEIEHNYNLERINQIIPQSLSKETYLPIIKAILLMKQKNPEISLILIYRLCPECFSDQSLINLLYHENY